MSSMKNFVVHGLPHRIFGIITLVLAFATSAQAQNNTATAPSSATMSTAGRFTLPQGLTLVPSVFLGERSDLQDTLTGSSAKNNTVGGFVRPEIIAGYKTDFLTVNFKYDF
jgi:hypothetical protein